MKGKFRTPRTGQSAEVIRGSLLLLLAFLLAACVGTTPPPTIETAAADVFESVDGLFVIEAEAFHAHTPQGGHEWKLGMDDKASGEAALQALPDSGTTRNSDFVERSPRLDYTLNFTETGTYYVWVLGRSISGKSGTSDSVHVGLDGRAQSSADRITPFATHFSWEEGTMDGPRATLSVSSTGQHTLNVWMREDGFSFDKIVLTLDPDLDPSELPDVVEAPVEVEDASDTFTQSDAGLVDIRAKAFHANTAQGSHTWQPVDGAMQALPDSGAANNTGYTSNSPRLDFNINFNRSGVHYVWVRGKAVKGDEGRSDSVHVGLDGKEQNTADRITGFAPNFSWKQQTMDGSVARIEVPSAGVHTLNVWMREDGFSFDRLVLTPDSSFVPTDEKMLAGEEPTEAPPEEPVQEPAPVNQAPVVNAGDDGFVTFPESITLSGTVEDDGLPSGSLNVTWRKVSGVGEVSFADAKNPLTEASFSTAGEYVLELLASDGEAQSSDRVTIIVEEEELLAEELPALPTNTTSVKAKHADAFVDTIGVNTHLHYTGTVYDQFDSLIKPKLLESGIRHIRDGVYTYEAASYDSFYYRRLRELGDAGIRFNLLTSLETRWSEATDYSKLDDIYTWTNGAVVSFEGINEPDLQGISNWVDLTRAAQKRLYETVKGNAATLGDVKVLGPSPVWNADKLGDLSAYLDYGNIHPYPGGRMPSGSEYGQGIDASLREAAYNSGSKPVIPTETGYHNALETSNTHPPTSELATGKYVPRLFFEYFNRGIPRTYLYEFIDSKSSGRLTNPEASFGLLRNDGSEKPAYRAVKNLIGLLQDPGSSFTTGTLQYGLEGNLEEVHQTLLQKHDGSFYLALWVERSSWDRDARKELTVAPQRVTLSLGQPISGVTLYTFDDSGNMSSRTASLDNYTVTFDLTDKVTVVELE